jgi:nicotinate-nucleotide pyrophosphorylase (carboxylating)
MTMNNAVLENTELKNNNLKLPWADALITQALVEDIGTGDITASLISKDTQIEASLITRSLAVVCGISLVTEVFKRVDKNINFNWKVNEGELVFEDTCLLEISGPARGILTAERVALNFLQFLSGTATLTRAYVDAILEVNSKTKLLDTRKTIPGFRQAQKYAVKIGGGENHRMGLYDAYLIKENHIASCGGVIQAIKAANKLSSGEKIEIEIESIEQLEQILDNYKSQYLKLDIIMLDNFDIKMIKESIKIRDEFFRSNLDLKPFFLEASGNMCLSNLSDVAKTGVDYISVGSITKHVHAIDLSLRVKD